MKNKNSWLLDVSMRKGEMQMKVKNLFKEKKKNAQMNLLNLEQRDWQPNLSTKEKKLQMN